MPPRTSTALVAVALGALSTAAALGLGRVFASDRYVLPVLGAVLVVHLIGAIARSREMTAFDVIALWVAALAGYLIWVLVPETTLFGLPTADTFETLARDLERGVDELRNAVVPAPARDGAVMLAVIAVWLMAATAEVLAFWRRAAIAALAPALALFIWTAALGTDSAATVSTLAFGAAALAFLLLAQQAALVTGRARFVGKRLGQGTGLLGAGALLGTIAIVVGLAVGNAVPGADAEPLLDLRGLGKEGNGPDSRSYRTEPPLARIGDDLTRDQPVPVFTVTSTSREYWRIVALDRYASRNGGEWTLTAAGADEVVEGLQGRVPPDAVNQRYEISGLDGRWMPAVYEPVSVEGGGPLVVQASKTLVTSRLAARGLRYAVSSRLPPAVAGAVTPEQRTATDRPVPKELREYTELPADFPADVTGLAQQVTAGRPTPYDRALALEEFFLDPAQGFDYSLKPELLVNNQSQSAISAFLDPENREGFCVQFAGSFAAMARAIGLPARVAVGFTPGRFDDNGQYFDVTTFEAHAWPEVYLAGLGWTRFEPTPATQQPGGADLPGRLPIPGTDETAGTVQTPTETTTPQIGTGAGSTPATTIPRDEGADVSIDTERGDEDDGLFPGWELFVAIVVAIVVAAIGAAGAIVLAKARRRTVRRRRADSGASIHGAWQEALDRLGEAGIRIDPAQTPLEIARGSPRQLPRAANAPLISLARAYSEARYGRSAPSPEEAAAAWQATAAVRAALDADVGPMQRWRRRLDPTALRR